VNGRPVEIKPANAAFRAVALDQGRSEVRFSYGPASVTAGGIISGAALVLALIGLLTGWSRAGRPPRLVC
jgi:uncharacterized membrane protein YfhO